MSSQPKPPAFLDCLTQVQNVAQLSALVDRILDEPDIVRRCYNETNSRWEMLNRIVKFLFNIPNRPLHVLIDWDVIRTYIETENTGQFDFAAVSSFFQNSTLPFFIPLGAFEELLSFVQTKLRPFLDDSTQEDLQDLEVLLNDLNGSVDRRGGAIQLTASRPATCASATHQVWRLNEVLSSPRFQGVRSEFRDGMRTESESILATKKRPTKGERSNVDRRDAINIAIAATTNDSSHPLPFHYLLLTQTQVVIETARDLYNNRYIDYWLAIRPDQLALADAFDLKQALGGKRAIAKDMREQLRLLSDSFENVIQGVADDDSVTDDQKNQFLADLKGVGSRLVRRGFPRLESVRSYIHSSDVANKHQVALTDASESEMSMQYWQLLDALRAIEGYRYRIHRSKARGRDDRPRPYSEFYIARFADDKDWSAGESLENGALRIRIFPSGDSPPLVTVQWELNYTEDKLIQCLESPDMPLRSLWSSAAHQSRFDPSEHACVVGVSDDSPLWNEGLVVTTSTNTLGIPPEFLLAEYDDRWSFLALDKLQDLLILHDPETTKEQVLIAKQAISQHRHGSAAAVIEAEAPASAAIQEIRLNTKAAHLVFDVVAPDHAPCRRFTILTNHPSVELIVHLYSWLGTGVAIREGLTTAVRDVLSHVRDS